MSIQAVLLPLFVQVVLTFVLLFWMGYLRAIRFRRRGQAARHRVARAELAAAGRPRSPMPTRTSSSCRFCSTC